MVLAGHPGGDFHDGLCRKHIRYTVHPSPAVGWALTCDWLGTRRLAVTTTGPSDAPVLALATTSAARSAIRCIAFDTSTVCSSAGGGRGGGV